MKAVIADKGYAMVLVLTRVVGYVMGINIAVDVAEQAYVIYLFCIT